MKKFTVTSLFLLMNLLGYNQEKTNQPILIQGTVYDSTSKETLPFATIINKASNIATITNSEGYFELFVESYSDTLLVSFVGYKQREFVLEGYSSAYKIALEVKSISLSEVNIVPKDFNYIYDLVVACKEKKVDSKKEAKVYYQLKSYIDGSQIELVENFYNGSIQGYDLLGLKLKTGRIGLQEKNEVFFASLESSKPIKMHRLFSESDLFPESPLELPKRRMKKNYYLELENIYADENGDSIHIVDFYPKNRKSYHFSTKLWINASDSTLLKLELTGSNIYDFPLVPVTKGDKLLDINLKITKTFEEIESQPFFKHIDFNYDFTYQKYYGDTYKVKTEAVLFAYEYDNGFNLPLSYLNDEKLSDYQQLSSLPYSHFFWENNNELRMHSELDSNALFLQDTLTLSNKRYEKKFSNDLSEIFNYIAIKWDTKRFAFRELPQYIPYVVTQPTFKFQEEIFLDYNNYNDSVNIVIESIFDSYKSYFKFNIENRFIDNTINCFINMHFDLVEIEKRKLEKAIENSDKSWNSVKRLHSLAEKNLKVLLESYSYDVGMGRNEQAMKSWNKYIKENLNIDNLLIFQVYQEVKED